VLGNRDLSEVHRVITASHAGVTVDTEAADRGVLLELYAGVGAIRPADVSPQ